MGDFFGLHELKRFFSLDFRVETTEEGIMAECYAMPFVLGGDRASCDVRRGVLPQEWMDYFAERLGMTRGFVIPPDADIYFGEPDPENGVTRCVMVSTGGGRGMLYLRRTPTTPPLQEWFDEGDKISLMMNDIVSVIVKTRCNMIVCGGSGSGKTRFVAAYVVPCVAMSGKKMLYVEAVSELIHELRRKYGSGAPHVFVSLGRRGMEDNSLKLGDVVSLARMLNFDVVIFQEMHQARALEEGWARPEDVRALISSGTPFVITTHPTMGDPVLTAQYYDQLFGIPQKTVLVLMGPKSISMAYIGADRGISLFWECHPDPRNNRQAIIGVYPTIAQEAELRELLLQITAREEERNGW